MKWINKGRVFFISMIAVASIGYVGCDHKAHKSPSNMLVKNDTVNVNFAGYDRGCKQYYNPIFCADKYKPKSSLQAGIGGDDNITIYIKDKEGKVIVLDRNQTEFLLNLKYKDK